MGKPVNEPLLAAGHNSGQLGAAQLYHTCLTDHHQHQHLKQRPGHLKSQQRRGSRTASGQATARFWVLTCISLLLVGLLAWALYCRLGPQPARPAFSSRLRLVSVLVRHADRAPSDALPPGDRHSEKPLFFWPNGLHNLTDAGRLRAYRTGLELRRQYADYLDRDPNSVLVISSPVARCLESAHHLLRGLFDNAQPASDNRRLFARLLNQECAKQGKEEEEDESCLGAVSRGSGATEEWRNIVIDSASLRSLSSYSFKDCRLLRNASIPVDADAAQVASVARLEGLAALQAQLNASYNYTKLTFDALTVFSTVKAELELARTRATLPFADHFRRWIQLPASGNWTPGGRHVISLWDVLERVSVVAARERLATTDHGRITLGPILESLHQAHQAATLEQPESSRFANRKLVVYYSHDTIIQLLLWRLGVCRELPGLSFEQASRKLAKQEREGDELAPFLAGLRMANYGVSVQLELRELVAHEDPTSKLHILHMNIYNRQDAKFHPIRHEPVQLGSACRRLFLASGYPASELERFYGRRPHFQQLDRARACPLALFHNLTADSLMDQRTFSQLCD